MVCFCVETKWKENYPEVLAANVLACAKSTAACLSICTAGLKHMYTQYRFDRGGTTFPFGEGFDRARVSPATIYSTAVVEGAKRGPPQEGAVGFHYEGEWLTGETMLAQMDKWAALGSLEQSAADSLRRVVEAGGSWTDLRVRRCLSSAIQCDSMVCACMRECK